MSWYGFVSQTSGQRALRRRHHFANSFNRLAALGGAAFVLAVGIVLPARAEPVSPEIETASVVSTPPDFRLASINPSLNQPIDAAPDFDFLIEQEMDVAVDGAIEPHWYNHFGHGETGQFARNTAQQRFDTVAEKANLSSTKLAGLFDKARAAAPAAASKPATLSIPKTALVHSASVSGTVDINARLALAYADPSPTPTTGALAAISALAAEEEEDSLASSVPGESPPEDGEMDSAGLPTAIPLPLGRPEVEEPVNREQAVERAQRPDRPKQLAYARPDNPVEEKSGGIGRAFRNLFGARPGKGVAVYDISAAKVYMPDGSVLEAHSGIGKMADNPRFVHVKMTGPTPPSTYNLRMRESRFHGVEAIRMLPIDGKNPHGRTGLLTHSYLLRGGRAESHGCVAFKDYSKFLTAFKKGKVKQLVVVPGGGRTTLLARNG